jgi:hypothetical protein
MKAIRHCWRCADCLTVAFTPESIEAARNERGFCHFAECGSCGGDVEYMGPVNKHHQIFRTELQCACDGRCTGAIGPSCDCQCGGENHGTGAMVEVLKRVEGLPHIMMPTDARAKAETYRALVAEFRAAWDAHYAYATREKRNGYVTPATYRTYMEGQEIISAFGKARGLRTHAGRNKRIAALTEKLVGRIAA